MLTNLQVSRQQAQHQLSRQIDAGRRIDASVSQFSDIEQAEKDKSRWLKLTGEILVRIFDTTGPFQEFVTETGVGVVVPRAFLTSGQSLSNRTSDPIVRVREFHQEMDIYFERLLSFFERVDVMTEPPLVASPPATEDPTRQLRVFLCHGREDKPAVRRLYDQLRAEGDLDPWLDAEKLLAGQNWEYEIRKAIRDSDVVIACLSSTSIDKSGYVQKEIKLALDEADKQPEGTIYVIPARLDNCTVPDRLSHSHWVDLFESGGYERLLRALRFRAASLATIMQSSTDVKPSVRIDRRLDLDNNGETNVVAIPAFLVMHNKLSKTAWVQELDQCIPGGLYASAGWTLRQDRMMMNVAQRARPDTVKSGSFWGPLLATYHEIWFTNGLTGRLEPVFFREQDEDGVIIVERVENIPDNP